MQLEQVRLTGASETLLITLQAKAAENAMPDSLLRDRFAADALHRIDQDRGHLNVGHDMTIGIALRAYMLDRWAEAFLERYPEATVLHLGCGLDSRIFRIDPGPGVRWFELDFPDVISLRQQIYPDRENCEMLACSLVEHGWIANLPADRPAIIIAEGVLPYLKTSTASASFVGGFPLRGCLTIGLLQKRETVIREDGSGECHVRTNHPAQHLLSNGVAGRAKIVVESARRSSPETPCVDKGVVRVHGIV
ncbi:class I SAM-dependent methyltransferase [Sinorhizobium meliloti]|uniref:class I SAM-dependent methyltransferase n=1 Tax=Rhizobium meliloti TaxID=382 RepID=UPI001F26E841|nr:class I SAM-dependent methyltransferase [Sinorhizobium meliloti]